MPTSVARFLHPSIARLPHRLHLSTVLNWFRTPSAKLLAEINTFREELATIKRNEAVRAAEWSDVLDKFERLYKRLVARQDRARRSDPGQEETGSTGDSRAGSGESPLSLRQRLRGAR